MTHRAGAQRELAACALGALLLLGGCHHKTVQPMVLPQTTPVPLANEPVSPPLLSEPPKPKLPEVPVAEAATKPKRVRKKAKAAASVPTAPPAASGETHAPASEAAAATAVGERESAAAIGALTVGSEQDGKTKQDAAELIAANERRLNMLSADVAKAQATLVAKVRNFQRDAQQALGSGDVEGARTLATKGKLLLDDLEKSGS